MTVSVGDQMLGGGRWVGRPVARMEDPHFLTGATSYVDDLVRADLLHVVFVRSPLAAARVEAIDATEARTAAGVVSVMTGADLDAPGLRPVLLRPEFQATTMRLLATGTVHHAGEAVAMVVATSRQAAVDAAELVWVDYEPVAAVPSLEVSLDPAGPAVHPGQPNVLLDLVMFDDEALDEVMADADLVIEERFTSGRVTASPLETRAALAEWDAREGRLILHASTQVPHILRTAVAEQLGLDENRVRVIAPDVGGGFGLKCVVGREEILVALAARRLRRPAKWVEGRRENLTASFHGHEQRYDIRAGFDREGVLLALEADILCDVGAYNCYPFTCGVEPLMAAGEMPGPYRLRHYRARTRGVATNKAPMAPYRGVSRPQITFVMERLMDKAARRLGLDPVEIRRRNLIQHDQFPYEGITGILYDEGSYRESLELAATAAEATGLPQRREAARRRGRLRGLGFACFSERSAYGTPVFAQRLMGITPGYELARVRMDPSGRLTVALGTSSHGQGHATTIAQIVADRFGVEPAWVRVVQGDTDAVPYGWGTFASRSIVLSGDAADRAAATLATRIKRIAAHLLEAAPEDLDLGGGRITVRGQPDAGIDLAEVARTAYLASHRLPADEHADLEERASADPPGMFSNATHAVELEVDPETGDVEIVRYVVVEDCGVMINPMIVEGQVRGGVAQGIAAALYEQLQFDEDAQPLTTNLGSYLVPTALEIPHIEVLHLETPSRHSETGAKGMGEGGTIGAPAAVINALNDALAPLGVELDHIPATPMMIRSAIASALERAEDLLPAGG